MSLRYTPEAAISPENNDRPVQLDYRHAQPTGAPVSVLAIVCFALAIFTLPCLSVQLLVPADMFNSVDLKYRAFFWSSLSGIPALLVLLLSWFARRRIRKKHLGGQGWTTAAIVISAGWVIGALFGLGVFGID
ncbi:MAG TPA: hypothetical protein VFE58_19050 [Tepidisphaeraceae bacterium]|jgi:hypothetical protein|nr:hypothetical protein [Tepidisphaeraceae bacterium]